MNRNGCIFSWGDDSDGALGLGMNSNGIVYYPSIITTLSGLGVLQIAASKNHMLALDRYGMVYSCGCGSSGQLGL